MIHVGKDTQIVLRDLIGTIDHVPILYQVPHKLPESYKFVIYDRSGYEVAHNNAHGQNICITEIINRS